MFLLFPRWRAPSSISKLWELARSSKCIPKPAKDARRIIVKGAGEGEANGMYVECTAAYDGRPQFLYAGKTRDDAQIIMWYAASGAQWSVRKQARAVGSTTKLWYIANTGTGADTSGEMPPLTGWAVSARANDRAYGQAAFSIDPAPTVSELAIGEPIPVEVARDMLERGIRGDAEAVPFC